MTWIGSTEHSRWLSQQMRFLLERGRAANSKTGFGHLTPDGRLDVDRPVDLAITARKTFAYSLGALLGIPGCRRYCDLGVRSMQTYFKDRHDGGWFQAIEHEPSADGTGVPWSDGGSEKSQRANAYMILAAATAAVASRPGAMELLRDALADQETHWWDESSAGLEERANADWSSWDSRRRMGTLILTVEAYLAAGEAMHDPEWIQRAGRLLERAYGVAESNGWRLPEHLDVDGNVLGDVDGQDGAPVQVIGHAMELARLGVQYRGALREFGLDEPEGILEGSAHLFERGRRDGWRRGGEPGFIYSTDLAGNPVSTRRLQWVACEGVNSAASLRRALLDDGAKPGEIEIYEHCYRSWLDFLHDYLMIDDGVYARSLDQLLDVGQTQGVEAAQRAGIYDALQALLAPRVPLWPPVGTSIQRGLLDKPEGAPARLIGRKTRGFRTSSPPLFSWRQQCA